MVWLFAPIGWGAAPTGQDALVVAPWVRASVALEDASDLAADADFVGPMPGGWAVDAEHLVFVLRVRGTVEEASAHTWVVGFTLGGSSRLDGAFVVGPEATVPSWRAGALADGLFTLVDQAETVATGAVTWFAEPSEDEPPWAGTGLVITLPLTDLAAEFGIEATTALRFVALAVPGEGAGSPSDVAGCVGEEDCGTLADALTDALTVDGDQDGLPTPTEQVWGSDASLPDTDGDGLADGLEGMEDPDEDGDPALLDPDADDDGIADGVEGVDDLDGDDRANHVDDDSDGDLRLDADEGVGDDDCDGVLNFVDSVDDDGFCDTAFDRPAVDDRPVDSAPDGAVPPSPEDYPLCGCAQGGVPSWGLGSLLLLVLRRRRR